MCTRILSWLGPGIKPYKDVPLSELAILIAFDVSLVLLSTNRNSLLSSSLPGHVHVAVDSDPGGVGSSEVVEEFLKFHCSVEYFEHPFQHHSDFISLEGLTFFLKKNAAIC